MRWMLLFPLLILLVILLGGALPAMEPQAPVELYWRMRAVPAAHADLTIHLIGTVIAEGQPLSLVYYRYAIAADEDGGPPRERELLLIMRAERLHGWYQITGTERAFALASMIGHEVVLPDGLRRTVWPLPRVLSETVTIDGKEQVQQYLLHVVPVR